MNSRVNIRTLIFRTLIMVVAVFVVLIGYAQYSHFKYHQEMAFKINTLKTGYKNLTALIEYQDKRFQQNGTYKKLNPSSNLSYIDNFQTCTDNCKPCEYAIKITINNFTATAKCEGKDGSPNYIGYIRVKPGEHSGIDGYYGKCKAEGIHAGSRSLINVIGPCFEQDNDYMFILSGSKKRLIIETLPNDVEVSINGSFLGITSGNHNATTSSYGSLFVSEPAAKRSFITLTKQGYEPIIFPVDWGSYTYKATVVLNASQN